MAGQGSRSTPRLLRRPRSPRIPSEGMPCWACWCLATGQGMLESVQPGPISNRWDRWSLAARTRPLDRGNILWIEKFSFNYYQDWPRTVMSAGRRLYYHLIQVQIGDVIKQSCGCNQFATAIGQHVTERLHVAGEVSRRLEERRALLRGKVFAATIDVKEFS